LVGLVMRGSFHGCLRAERLSAGTFSSQCVYALNFVKFILKNLFLKMYLAYSLKRLMT